MIARALKTVFFRSTEVVRGERGDVRRMAENYEHGRDIWSGEGLRGTDEDDWLRETLKLPLREDESVEEKRIRLLEEIQEILLSRGTA